MKQNLFFRYFMFFKEFGTYNKQVRLVKSRSNSRGSILEDFLASQVNMKNMTSNLNLSLTTVLGAKESENVVGSQSSYQAYHKVHESACEYEFFLK